LKADLATSTKAQVDLQAELDKTTHPLQQESDGHKADREANDDTIARLQ
jgi:hypothetical protein